MASIDPRTPHVDVGGNGLPDRLRRLRLERGLTKQELAERAGLSGRTVRDLENRRRDRVQEKTVLLIAEALEVEPAVLLGTRAESVSSPPAVTHRRPSP